MMHFISPQLRSYFLFRLVAPCLLFLCSLSSAALALNIDVKTFTLANGMQVVVIPDHRAPVVTHMVWYKVGAADEPKGKAGIAHFLEHLLFKGTPKHPAGEFSRILRRNGAEENAFTTQDYTGYYQRISKDRLDLVMDLESDRMSNLQLSEKEVIPELAVVQEERRSRVDNEPSSLLVEQMDAALFTAHPYGKPVIGWMSEVMKLDYRDAMAFYRAHYTPANAIVVVAGDVAIDEVRRLAEKYYGPLPNTATPEPRVRTAEPEPIAARRIIMSDPRMGIDLLQRSYLVPSFSTASANEAAALDVLSDIMGGNASARLSKRLVDKDKVAQETGAFYSGDEMDYGKLVVYAAAAPGSDLSRAEQAIDRVISDIIEKGVTGDELSLTKKRLRAELIYSVDAQSALAQMFGEALATGSSIEDVLTYTQRLDNVTAAEVKAAAAKYLRMERSVTGVITPPKAVN
ncbi:MAG TPA: pitrilysin family protein [Candidatus Binatia bacterium]|jgi:zinc protease|nr:pitrilysin family protein [Candidatus Binatia bacterium]